MFAALTSLPVLSSPGMANRGALVLPRNRPLLPIMLRRSLSNLAGLLRTKRYRPERHYMRGGRTEGSRCQARERMIRGG